MVKWALSDGSNLYHKTVYNKNSLTSLLERVGFSDITFWDWREVFKDNLEYDDHSQAYFPHMDKENGIHISLNIQCKKS